MTSPFTAPLRLAPALKERVWGGQQLGGTAGGPNIGEAWILHEDQVVQAGPLGGRSLGELAQSHPAELLGAGRLPQRFPLLVKLLDCQDWLSVQVHPDDAHARQRVGPQEYGKTEAWHILKAEPQAKLIAGTRAGVTLEEVQAAILRGEVQGLTHEHAAQSGETLLVPAGILHALGGGLLIYEIQQSSDTTYRVYDWNRPAAAGRELHLEASAAVVKLGQAVLTPAPSSAAGTAQTLTACDYFVLDLLTGKPQQPQRGDTAGQSFHVLTVKSGTATLTTGAGEQLLAPYDTVLLPAALGSYTVSGEFEVLRGKLP